MQNSGYSQKQKGQIRPKTHHSWHSSVKNNNNKKQKYINIFTDETKINLYLMGREK